MIQTLPVNEITVRKEDYPPQDVGKYPPDSDRFTDLKNSIKQHGMRTPVFINDRKVIVQGHYRYWAAKEIKLKEVPVVYVRSERDIADWFDNLLKA